MKKIWFENFQIFISSNSICKGKEIGKFSSRIWRRQRRRRRPQSDQPPACSRSHRLLRGKRQMSQGMNFVYRNENTLELIWGEASVRRSALPSQRFVAVLQSSPTEERRVAQTWCKLNNLTFFYLLIIGPSTVRIGIFLEPEIRNNDLENCCNSIFFNQNYSGFIAHYAILLIPTKVDLFSGDRSRSSADQWRPLPFRCHSG